MRRENGDFERVAGVGTNARRVTISGLDRGTNYTFRVRAVNAAGQSDYSNEATVTTRG